MWTKRRHKRTGCLETPVAIAHLICLQNRWNSWASPTHFFFKPSLKESDHKLHSKTKTELCALLVSPRLSETGISWLDFSLPKTLSFCLQSSSLMSQLQGTTAQGHVCWGTGASRMLDWYRSWWNNIPSFLFIERVAWKHDLHASFEVYVLQARQCFADTQR